MPSTHSFSLFDIAGPIMIGPSSSHTAGACKIGQFARALFNKTPEKITFILHGSFGEVYKGHATDRALLAGVMKFKTSDPRLKNAFEIARQKKISYEFRVENLGEKYHPNTVKIILEAEGKKEMSIIGSSIGGGNIIIVKINEFEVNIHGVAGKFKTLVTAHDLSPSTLTTLTNHIWKKGIRVAAVESSKVNGHALSVIHTEGRKLTLPEVLELEKLSGIEFIRSLTRLANA